MEDFYEINDLMKYISEKPVVVDIGANVGYFSFLMAAKRAHAQVLAYEPMEQNIQLFRSNLLRNKELAGRVQAHHLAVTGSEIASVKLYFDDVEHNTVISSVFEDFARENTRSVEIKAISLARIIRENNLQRIDLLKLDCEGSEYPILYESPEEVWPMIQCIAAEVHEMDKDKRNHGHLSRFLKNKGFTISRSRLDANGCYYMLAYRKNG